MTEPVATYGNLRFWDNFGEYGFATKLRVEGLRNLGGVLSPFNAFLLLQGMETLPLRMDAHVANAQTSPSGCDADPRVSWVRYAGLPDDPNHALAQKYLPQGPGRGVLVRLSRAAARRARRSSARVELCSHLANVGDTRTLVIHPGSTTHRQLSEPRRSRRPACCPSSCASASASRTSTTSSTTSIGRSDEPHDLRPTAWTAGRSGCAILRRAKTIAVVGASANPARASNFVLTYLLLRRAPTTRSGRSRPNETEILGVQALPVARRPAGRRPTSSTSSAAPTQLPGVAREAVDAGAGAFWMQLGLHSDEAVRDRARRPGWTSSPTAA